MQAGLLEIMSVTEGWTTVLGSEADSAVEALALGAATALAAVALVSYVTADTDAVGADYVVPAVVGLTVAVSAVGCVA